jgi:polysaccharide pyruvyl transferase WcaK-like protein
MGSLEIRTRIRKRADMSTLKCKGSLQFKGRDSLHAYKIALLTPYGGKNLGDAAIQEAVIANIRKRYPSAHIYLITLWPENTTKLHGVSSFPITTLAIPYYASGLSIRNSRGNDADTPMAVRCDLLSRAKSAIKRSSLLYTVLKLVYTIAFKMPRAFCIEMLHIIRAYKFLKGATLLLISGGGQLDDYWGGPWGHPYALLKWGLLARAVGARYIFLSVGTCALESRLTTCFIRYALRLATYRSYRDQTSKKLLEHMVFTHKDVVCPDLAFSYVNWRIRHQAGRSNVGRVVGVSPIAYLSRYSWPKKDISAYEHYFGHLVRFISDLIRQGYSIVFFSTDSPDRKVINDVVTSLANDISLNINGRIYQPHIDTLDDLFDQLCNVDYIVSSRLHGVILSHLLCIPVLAISYDRKVDTHMTDMGLSEYCLDIHNLETVSLIKSFESLTMNSDRIKLSLKEKAADYACALKRQYDFVLGM